MGWLFLTCFFTDDLVLFAKVDHVNCSIIRDVLDGFCAQSGQSINESKSRVYFSLNIDVDTRIFVRYFGIQVSSKSWKVPWFSYKASGREQSRPKLHFG